MSHNIATRYNIDSNLFFQNLELQQGFYVRSERLRGTVTSNSISLNKIYLRSNQERKLWFISVKLIQGEFEFAWRRRQVKIFCFCKNPIH